MTKLRRFEVLLPLKFNDGRPVPDELISTTLAEIEAHFGAVSWETQIIQGFWSSKGTRYRDELFRFFVDVPDLPEHRHFFAGLKDGLKARFQQLDIWMTTHPIDVL
jgi:hypothetical protein